MSWIYFQSSKKRKRSSDCAVRSLMAATGMSWDAAFNVLCDFARKVQDMPNETRVLTKAIESLGYKAEKAPLINHRKLTLREFAKMNPKGSYFVYMSGHVVFLKNGNWYDTWDSGDYKVLKYFKK